MSPLLVFAALGEACAILAAALSLPGLLSAFRADCPQPLAALRSFNGYGLFRVMTTTRPEVVIEGSNDGPTGVDTIDAGFRRSIEPCRVVKGPRVNRHAMFVFPTDGLGRDDLSGADHVRRLTKGRR